MICAARGAAMICVDKKDACNRTLSPTTYETIFLFDAQIFQQIICTCRKGNKGIVTIVAPKMNLFFLFWYIRS